ncbi:hypothetical protein Avbf_09941 [Armadillidium vulgare]|nr:hypothetical protein Avbf_09941 [Armadillidium vulgare]
MDISRFYNQKNLLESIKNKHLGRKARNISNFTARKRTDILHTGSEDDATYFCQSLDGHETTTQFYQPELVPGMR